MTISDQAAGQDLKPSALDWTL